MLRCSLIAGAVNINDVVANLMCTTAPMGGWKESGIGARFGGADGMRKYCRQETVVTPRTNVGAGGNYYNNSRARAEADEQTDDEDGTHPPAPRREVTLGLDDVRRVGSLSGGAWL